MEPNGRDLTDGQSPWSIRQTAIYHKIAPGDIPDLAITSREIRPISTFLLVAPSLFAERNILRGVESAREAEEPISPWYVHWVLMTDSLRDWKDYMAWVENKLKEQVGSSNSEKQFQAHLHCEGFFSHNRQKRFYLLSSR